jgi:hypothetical protein
MKVIYIAGPYRDARGEFYVRMNIRAAELAALFVWRNGGAAICPHKNTAGFGGALGESEDIVLRGDLELMRRSDAVWAIDGYETSAGTCNEIKQARELGLPVFSDQYELLNYLLN